MSRYSGYYRKKQSKSDEATPWPPSESESVKSFNDPTSRETPFYEETELTLKKWREQMGKVFSPIQMGLFEKTDSKVKFDAWCVSKGITPPT